MTQMQDRLKSATIVRRKGKDPVGPARIETIRTADGSNTTYFLFPRSEAISASDKEVFFETALGPLEVKQKFVLKEMQFSGSLSL